MNIIFLLFMHVQGLRQGICFWFNIAPVAARMCCHILQYGFWAAYYMEVYYLSYLNINGTDI